MNHARIAALVAAWALVSGFAWPKFNEVYRLSSHNAYWVQRTPVLEAFASGAQERFLDLIAFDQSRSLEIDIHKSLERPHDWDVYHTERIKNSFCNPFSECLKILRQYHYLNPRHEALVIVIELKEIIEHNFDAKHTPADLDRILEKGLGELLYRPRDFLARCAPGSTMRDCAREKGWPTTDEMRGKILFTVLGNWRWCTIGHGGQGGVEYATWKGDGGAGVRDRSAFPMEANWINLSHESCGSEYVPGNLIWEAKQASVFMQAEALDPAHWAKAEKLQSEGVMIRPSQSDGLVEQEHRLALGVPLVQTDYAWFHYGARGPQYPVLPIHPEDFDGHESYYEEPGLRLYFSANGPSPGGAGVSLTSFEPVSDWETFPAATRPSPAAKFANPRVPRGKGCLQAASADPAAGLTLNDSAFRICRQTVAGKIAWSGVVWPEEAVITVETVRDGSLTRSSFHTAESSAKSAGDLIRLEVRDEPAGGSCTTAYGSAENDAAGKPVWKPLVTECFAAKLPFQGLTAETGDVLFIGTHRNGKPVRGSDFGQPYGGGFSFGDLSSD